jgi:hypothetical protein
MTNERGSASKLVWIIIAAVVAFGLIYWSKSLFLKPRPPSSSPRRGELTVVNGSGVEIQEISVSYPGGGYQIGPLRPDTGDKRQVRMAISRPTEVTIGLTITNVDGRTFHREARTFMGPPGGVVIVILEHGRLHLH